MSPGRSWRRACRRSAPATEEAEAIAPVLSYVLGVEEARPRDFEPEQLQRQIALAARTLVERRLQQEPLLIVVEDLHWADAASVDLLRARRRSSGGPAADGAALASARHAPAARRPGRRSRSSGSPRSPRRDAGARGRPVRPVGRRRLRPAPGFRRHAGRRQSAVRRGDRAQPGEQGRARPPGRSLDVHGGVRGGGRSAHAARAAALPRRPAARRCPAPAPGGGRAGGGVRRGAAARRRDRARHVRGGARPARRGRSDPAGRARRARATGTGSRTRSCTRWSTRTSCSPAAPSCTSGRAGRSSAPPARTRSA